MPVIPPAWCSLAAHAPQIVYRGLSYGTWAYHTLTENVVPDMLSGRLFPTSGLWTSSRPGRRRGFFPQTPFNCPVAQSPFSVWRHPPGTTAARPNSRDGTWATL